MGLHDRDYSRDDSWTPANPWTRAENAPSITVLLIIINVVVFFVDLILSGKTPQESLLANWFEVRPETLPKPWLWYQFLTYGFLHSLTNIRHVAFNMLGLFFFGRAVENQLGRAEFLRFYLVSIVVGGIVTSARWAITAMMTGVPLQAVAPGTIGASGGVMAVTILFAFLNPHANILVMMVFPMKAWLVAVFFVGANIFGMLGGQGDTAYDVHLAGAGFAALYAMKRWRLEKLDPAYWGFSLSSFTKRRPKLRLHDPDRRVAKEEAEADRLLEKIQASGIDSLTNSERKLLERYSRRKRESRQS